MQSHDENQAVLVSGGLDSAILTAEIAATGATITPLYVRTHLGWEREELECLNRFLSRIARPNLQPLIILECPVRDLYSDHWSVTGKIPDAAAPDESFYLPGRNVILLSKSLIWCRMHDVRRISLGTLAANPFPDATKKFFRDFAAIVSTATAGELEISIPYATLSKQDVILRGAAWPLEHTLSCMNPHEGRHCGVCGKCAERGRAFLAAKVADPTLYLCDQWKYVQQIHRHQDN